MKRKIHSIGIAAAVLLGLAALLYLGGLLGQLLENYSAWQQAGGMAGLEEIQRPARILSLVCRQLSSSPG